MYALAIDLGTTTLAASLIDTVNGERLSMAGAMNPQRRFGADVVARLDAAVHSGEVLLEMSAIIRAELLRLGREVCAKAGIAWSDISQIAIAGNPAMQHILLGLPVKSLAFPPYRPLFSCGKTINASELNWPGDASIHIFPMPGGFVGGDTVAFLYGQSHLTVSVDRVRDSYGSQSPVPGSRLFLDMGTNGEMALVAGDTIWATSAAAGPAFEGGNLSCGMAALPGAVSAVRIADEKLKISVIGNVPPRGICGSAAIEAAAEMLGCGLLEHTGRLRDAAEIPSNLAARLIVQNDENAFVIYRDAERLLLLTQSDIRQIQLAKGAIRAGMEVLFDRSGILPGGLEQVVLTGSFGAVLNPEWLKTVGVFDENMVKNTVFIPEGALAGAERALCRDGGFKEVESLAARFRVIPLSGTPLFESLFLNNIDFPM